MPAAVCVPCQSLLFEINNKIPAEHIVECENRSRVNQSDSSDPMIPGVQALSRSTNLGLVCISLCS